MLKDRVNTQTELLDLFLKKKKLVCVIFGGSSLF